MPRQVRRRFRASAALLGALLAFALLEGGLRVFHGRRGTYAPSDAAWLETNVRGLVASPDEELVYVNRPDFVAHGGRAVEAHGILRPDDVATTKPPGVLRLAVVGDSIGASGDLTSSQRFTAVLERRLSRDLARAVEVLNFCTDGYATLQEARLLETSVSAFDVDEVLVLYCLNDAAESFQPMRAFRAPKPPASYAVEFFRDFVGRASTGGAQPLLAPLDGPNGPAADHWRRMYDPDGAGWTMVARGFDRMAAWSNARRVPLGVAASPLLLDDDLAGATTAGFRRQVADAAAARGLPFLDLQPVCLAAPLAELKARADDIYHFSALGHAVLADRLIPFVRGPLAR